ncbi:hypothetical protein GCM10027563_42330 [Parasphingorhabdus pacifica]
MGLLVRRRLRRYKGDPAGIFTGCHVTPLGGHGLCTTPDKGYPAGCDLAASRRGRREIGNREYIERASA